jgi:hypothetical protein
MTEAPLTCVRVGWGTVARIHEDATRGLGVRTVGVVEIDPSRHEAIRQAGLRPFTTCGEAAESSPTFWDICTPLRSHVDTFAQISALDPAANVVIEKPVCGHCDIPDLRTALDRHDGRVVVNENYASSAVTEAVTERVAALGLRPVKVIVEMTKHRGGDFLAGRFLDPALGAFGYEGTHLLTVAGALGAEYRTGVVYDVDVDHLPAVDTSGSPLDNSPFDLEDTVGQVRLNRQGGAFVGYRTASGCRVELYSSMSGLIGYPCVPYAPAARIEQTDGLTRYRIFRVDGVDQQGTSHQVVGFYEPLPGLSRGQGALAVFREWELIQHEAPIADATMSRHFDRILRYFTQGGPNPCPPEEAIETLLALHDWAEAGFADETDSDEVLGRADTDADRKRDARRFRLNDVHTGEPR